MPKSHFKIRGIRSPDILIEFQSSSDRFMAVRMLSYLTLLWQDLIRQGKTQDGLLPPVLPIVLYNGDEPWKAPFAIEDLIQTPPTPVARFLPSFRYILLDETRISLGADDHLKNLAGIVFRAEQVPQNLDLLNLLCTSFVWVNQKYGPEIAKALLDWAMIPNPELRPHIHDISKGNQAMLETQWKRWTNEIREEGLEEGIEKGHEQGILDDVLDLVQSGDLPRAKAIARLHHLHDQKRISTETLQKGLQHLGAET